MLRILGRLYEFLTENNEVNDEKFLAQVLKTTRSKDAVTNLIEIFQSGTQLYQIDFYQLLKVCFKDPIPLKKFVLLYHILIKHLRYLEVRSVFLIHEYVKNHPELHKDELLISPFKFSSFKYESHEVRPSMDLNYSTAKGKINYLLKSELMSSVFNSQAMSQIEDNEIVVRLINTLIPYHNVVLAGGYPTALLDHTIEYNPQSDIDVFIYGSNRKNRMQCIIQDLETEFKGSLYYKQHGSVVTFWVQDTPIRIQLIVSQAKNLFDLLFNFDFNYCSWAYLPKEDRFAGTLDSFYSIITRTTFLSKTSLRLERLLKAHYKGYSIVKYKPFEVSNDLSHFPDDFEIFVENGINIENLEKILPETEYRFDYYVPQSSLSSEKNRYDLRKYYQDPEIKLGSVDLGQINYWGIKNGYGYHDNKQKSQYDLTNPDDYQKLLKVIDQIEWKKYQNRNIDSSELWEPTMWSSKKWFIIKTAPVLTTSVKSNFKGDSRSPMITAFLADDPQLKEIISRIQIKAEETLSDGEELTSVPMKKPDVCCFKVRSSAQIWDLNNHEVELETDGHHWVILEFRPGEIWEISRRKEKCLTLPCKSIKYC